MMFHVRDRKRIAPESAKTQRARDKLRKHFAKQERFITPDALKETVEKIHQWIASHSQTRVLLKNKEIRLFDQNQNAASLSRKVQEIARKISCNEIESSP